MSRFLIVYLFFCITYIYGFLMEFHSLTNVTKGLPLLLLITQMILTKNPNRLILIGFIFSLIGDILLLPAIDIFNGGLLSFLIAHILFGIAFYNRNPKLNFQFAILYYVLGAYLLFVLYDQLGDFVIPVAVYIFAITTMTWLAKNQSIISRTYRFAYYGALSFIVSDTVLALNRFSTKIELAGLYVIITYWAAQYLIYKSCEDR